MKENGQTNNYYCRVSEMCIYNLVLLVAAHNSLKKQYRAIPSIELNRTISSRCIPPSPSAPQVACKSPAVSLLPHHHLPSDTPIHLSPTQLTTHLQVKALLVLQSRLYFWSRPDPRPSPILSQKRHYRDMHILFRGWRIRIHATSRRSGNF
jgi:hypothetical protein